MSENVQITPGTGVTIGADGVIDSTLGAAQIQYIKIMDGTIGGTNKAAVTANGLAVDGSGVTQPISGTITAQQSVAANLLATTYLNDGTGNPITSTSGSLNVDVTNTVPVSQINNSASGTFTGPGQTLSITTVGCATVQYATTGPSWVGTIITEVSYDNGTTWFPQSTVDTNPTVNLQFPTWGNSVSNTFNDDSWIVNVAGTTNFRLRVVTFTSGSLSLEIISTAAASNISNPTNDRWNAGAISALNGVQMVSTAGCASCGVQISGTFIGTLTFQASMDNHSFFPVSAINVSTNAIATTATAPGNYIVTCGGYNLVQVTMSAYTSGSAVIIFNAGSGSNILSFQDTGLVTTSAPSYVNGQIGALSLTTAGALRVDGSAVTQPVSGTVTVQQPTAASLLTTAYLNDGSGNPITSTTGSLNVNVTNASGLDTVNQGNPNTLANAWPVELSDGTNLLGTSSHPVRIDPTGTTIQPISGTVTANAGTGNFTVVQSSGSNLHVDVDNFPATQAVTQSGTWTVGRTWTLASGSDSVSAVQSGSWTVTANIGTTGGLALDTTVAALEVGQGSTTSGQKGILELAAVTTSAPSYTTGQTSPLSLTTVGALRVDGSAVTQPVSGTVTANQGTSPWVVSLTSTTITGTVAVTQSTSPWVVSGTVTANIGTTGGLALDTSVTNPQFTAGTTSAPSKVNLIGGKTSDATAQYQPLPLTNGGAAVKVDGSAVTQPVSGTVTSNQGAPNTLANAWSVEITDGTNVLGTSSHPLRIDPTGTTTQPVNVTNSTLAVTQSGTWTVGRTWTLASGSDSVSAVQSGNWSVRLEDGSGNNITSTSNALDVNLKTSSITLPISAVSLPLPTGASTSANQTNGSQKTQIVDGSGNVIASTSNSLNVDVTNTVPVTLPSDVTPATQNITVQDTGSTTTSGANSQAIYTGTPTTGSVATFTANSLNSVEVQVTGTWTGTLQVEASLDGGTTWYKSGGHQKGVAFNSSSFTANFQVETNVAGFTNIRVRATAAMTGTATVRIVETTNEASIYVTNPIALVDGLGTSNQATVTAANALKVDGSAVTQPISGTVTANAGTGNFTVVQATAANLNATITGTVTSNQGTAAALSGAWPVEITDGTNILGTSSHPVRIDPTGTTTQPVSGTVTANQGGAPWSQNITEIAGSAISTAATGIAKVGLTDGTGNAITSTSGALNENISSVGGVTVAATTKGTSTTNYIPVQQSHNLGRNYLTFTAEAVAGVTAETLLTFNVNKQGTVTTGVTNYTPTSGKTLRITGAALYVQSGAGAGGWSRLKLRHNTAGATTTSSALIFTMGTGTTNATGVSNGLTLPIEEGIEIYGDGTQTIGLCHISEATTTTESVTVFGYEY